MKTVTTLHGPEVAIGAEKPESTRERVVLIGNPNVGKSVIFGFLTGRYVTVSNYPGTTVTLTKGKTEQDGREIEIIDTPGVNSLVPMSEDERVTRDILLENPAQAVVQVVDAKNLRRGLLISTQLAELSIPFALDLNMSDEADDLGVRIKPKALEEAVGVPVAQTVAVRRKGFAELRQAIRDRRESALSVVYPAPVENAIQELILVLPQTHVGKRGLATTILAGDSTVMDWLATRLDRSGMEKLEAIRLRTANSLGMSLTAIINRARIKTVDALLEGVEIRPRQRQNSLLDAFGHWAMHPVVGIPILLVVLFAMYQFVGVLGAGIAVDFLETTIFGNYIGPWAMQAADLGLRFPHVHLVEDGVMLPDYTITGDLVFWEQGTRFVHDLLVGPYGQVTMALSYAIALILPIVATFFIAFGVLEDSGYLPRLAVMVNKVFRVLGLNGKAVLPMVLGLGCDTMATLTTRILETKKERILVTLLLALGVPCSAQLGVILGMIRALSLGATLIWAGSILITLFSVGWIAARLVPGERSDFILELPPIRRPQFSNIAVKTMARIEWYLREAVPLFLLGTLILFLMNTFRLLGVLEKASAPLVQGILGLPAKSSEAFLVGFLRRDYGAAGLYDLSREGAMDGVQLVVAMVTITLFVPCIANFMIMIKERGMRTALTMVAFIVPMAFLVGGALNWGLRAFGVTL